ncbi:hypothetical protein JKP88DRAFT_284898 [Tribonema minus]|uniref:Uncharacterized protein n=1 Tax=Tribonema minus TaxID=303371 RepID=A0A836CMC5_9STRA|nr:hypothetical protein JKP88DRAFT_284898 [Tribonema minus]
MAKVMRKQLIQVLMLLDAGRDGEAEDDALFDVDKWSRAELTGVIKHFWKIGKDIKWPVEPVAKRGQRVKPGPVVNVGTPEMLLDAGRDGEAEDDALFDVDKWSRAELTGVIKHLYAEKQRVSTLARDHPHPHPAGRAVSLTGP